MNELYQMIYIEEFLKFVAISNFVKANYYMSFIIITILIIQTYLIIKIYDYINKENQADQ